MKICWDMLEGVKLTVRGNFVKGTVTYVYKEACVICGEPYLTEKSRQSKFCGNVCSNSGKNNPMYGKTHSVTTRKKISVVNSGKIISVEARKKMSTARSGKNSFMYGKTHSIETRKKISKALSRRIGILNPNYKEGVTLSGLTVYDTYKDKLGPYEDIRKQQNTGLLEIKCTYCGRWYIPTHQSVRHRIVAINTLNKGECRFYCSENCKQACPTYGQKVYPKGFKHATSREVSTYLRQLVLERDNWTCQICGKTIKEIQLHVHHMDPVAWNSMFQNDMGSCTTLCKECHKTVHSRIGCRYIDLRCKKIEQISESKVLSIKGD